MQTLMKTVGRYVVGWVLSGLFLFTLSMGALQAKEAIPIGEDPQVQARMMNLASVLRCLVCQNQTIADSHADLAADLRNQIVEMIHQGKSDDEIMEYMTARYGDFVLYRPPIKTSTLLLWFGPLFLVVIGGFTLYRSTLKRQGNESGLMTLTPEQQSLTDQLLNRKSPKS